MITHGAGRGSAGRLRRRADGPRPRHGQVPAHAALRHDARLLAQVGAAARAASRARRSGPSCTSRPFGGWAARRASSCSTTCARACSRRTSTTRRSIRSTATCSRTTARSRCRAGSAIPIARARSSRASATPRGRRSRGCASRPSRRRRRYLDRWEEHWADTRIHGTTKRQVAAMFAEEKPALRALPIEPFRYYRYGERTVHLDGCVEVDAAYYGAPPGWIGRKVQVQWDGLHVRLLDPKTGQLLREHLRQRRGRHRIQEEDRPARTPQTTRGAAAPRAHRRHAHRHALRADPPQRRRARRAAHPRACSPSPRSTAPPPSTTRPRPLSSSARRATASSAATSSGARPCR